ncbi:COLI1 protein, partial [Serilophus lunatus]|nr:COLI1 protein [Serilophus lunatus]
SFSVVLGLLLWDPSGALAPCWESPKCQDFSSRAGMLACAAACRAQLSMEFPVYPGNGHLQPLSESIRKYVMSHFRWNKFGWKNGSSVAGQKREEGAGNVPAPSLFPFSQRLEVPPGKAAEREEGKRSYSMEHFRWGKPVGRKRRPVKVYPNGAEEEAEGFPLEFRRDRGEEEEEEEGAGGSREEGKSRWESLPKDKRYGGFMSSEQGRTPLVTLFRNTLGKSVSK